MKGDIAAARREIALNRIKDITQRMAGVMNIPPPDFNIPAKDTSTKQLMVLEIVADWLDGLNATEPLSAVAEDSNVENEGDLSLVIVEDDAVKPARAKSASARKPKRDRTN